MNANESVKLTLPNQLSCLPIAQAVVRESARSCGFEETALSEIEVAVEEAATNVMKHAYDVEENPTFDIVCTRLAEGLQIVLREKGIPFDPKRIPRYKPEHMDLDSSSAGMGFHLMRSMMDDIQLVNLGSEGKETRMLKLFKNPAGAGQASGPITATPAEPQVIQEKIAYDVRLMTEQEAIEVSRCAFKSHGYSFFDDHIYYPERLVELNQSGAMISAVAVTKHNVFMGHAALLYQHPEDRIPELTFVFVNVEFRGQGAFNRLNEFLMQTPKRRPCVGIYAYAVANHIFTQKTMARYGINDCGILLATSPRTWKFKGIAGDPTQRITVILAFKYLEMPKPITLYAPAHHRDMLAKLYQNLGATPNWGTPPATPVSLPESGSEITTDVNHSESCAEIYVKRYGQNIVREVRNHLRRFCLEQTSCINLFLNLEDPATQSLTGEFERMGFFFAGILPCARIGDTLILQYLNNVDLDYEKIAAYSDVAKELLAYIRAHDPNASL
ncbi:MAG: ATP-binding protein [Verrucomicrobia bacterium]|nr:ATP-binding protein [Verrucomicrobiota bacterium]